MNAAISHRDKADESCDKNERGVAEKWAICQAFAKAYALLILVP